MILGTSGTGYSTKPLGDFCRTSLGPAADMERPLTFETSNFATCQLLVGYLLPAACFAGQESRKKLLFFCCCILLQLATIRISNLAGFADLRALSNFQRIKQTSFLYRSI